MQGDKFTLPQNFNLSGAPNKAKQKQLGLWIAPGATVVGDVRFGNDVSVWYTAVVRGDINYIEIGEGSNLQDAAVIHVTNAQPCIIAKNVTIGHRATVHAAEIGQAVLVGMNSCILSGAKVGHGSIIAAGAVVLEKQIVEPFSLMVGVPAKKARTLNEKSLQENIGWAKKYVLLKNRYLESQFSH